jgi:hypothetical protein
VAFVGGQFGKPVILPQYVYNQFFFFHDILLFKMIFHRLFINYRMQFLKWI